MIQNLWTKLKKKCWTILGHYTNVRRFATLTTSRLLCTVVCKSAHHMFLIKWHSLADFLSDKLHILMHILMHNYCFFFFLFAEFSILGKIIKKKVMAYFKFYVFLNSASKTKVCSKTRSEEQVSELQSPLYNLDAVLVSK